MKYHCSLEEPRSPRFFYGQQNIVPNLKLYNPIVLVILNLLSLLCMLYSSLDGPNHLLYSRYKLSVSLTLNLSANHNIYAVSQLIPRNKLIWRELCA